MRQLAIFSLIAWILTGLFLALFFLKQTDLSASDLGRHVQNGKQLAEGKREVLTANFYSYTTPEYPFVNHHWLFGLAAYEIWQWGGFSLLTLVVACCYIAAIMLMSFWHLPRTRWKWLLASAAICLALPLFAFRVETRPEAFSMLFLALSAFAWRGLLQTKRTWQVMSLGIGLVLLQIVWVNIHIFFLFNLMVGTGYLVETLLHKRWRASGLLLSTLVIVALTSLVTPLGPAIALYPLSIFNGYAYPVAENQPIWFFLRFYPHPQWWYQFIFVTSSIAAIVLLYKKMSVGIRPLAWSAGLLLVGALCMVRLASFAALLMLPLLNWLFWFGGQKLHAFQTKHRLTWQSPIVALLLSMSMAVGGATIILSDLFNPFYTPIGLGLTNGSEKLAAFLQQPEFAGKHIFNNYDIGGYLIWHQQNPQYVFTDNRPEAYPEDFMENVYIASQEDEAVWERVSSEYDIELIVFNRHDRTDWGQPFLARRLGDEQWKPIFYDDYAIVFIKNTPENQNSITQFGLPLEMFLVYPTGY